VVVTTTVTGAAGACEAGGGGASNEAEGVAAVTVTVEAGAAGLVRPAEQPASRKTDSKGSAISFMSNSCKYWALVDLISKGCGRPLGDFLGSAARPGRRGGSTPTEDLNCTYG
jgi:L-alanine-DL-glutamate epimerase-like enolase superfamily enzyme